MSSPDWPAEFSRNHLHCGAATWCTTSQTSLPGAHVHSGFNTLHQSRRPLLVHKEHKDWLHASHQSLPAPYPPSHFASSGVGTPSPTALQMTASMPQRETQSRYHAHHYLCTRNTAPSAPSPSWCPSHSFTPSIHGLHGADDDPLAQHSSPPNASSLDIEGMHHYRMRNVLGTSAAATGPTSSLLTSLPTSFAPLPIRLNESCNATPELTLSGRSDLGDISAPSHWSSTPIRRLSSASSHFSNESSSTDSFDASSTSRSGGKHFPDLTTTSLSSGPSSPASLLPLSEQARADEMLKRLRSPSSQSKEGVAACDYCRKRKIRCNRQKPTCGKCLSLGKQCATNDTLRKRGPPSRKEKELLAAQGLHFISRRVRRRRANDEASREAAINEAAAPAHVTAQHHQQRHRPSSASSSASSSLSAIGSAAAQDAWCVAWGSEPKAKGGGAGAGRRGSGST